MESASIEPLAPVAQPDPLPSALVPPTEPQQQQPAPVKPPKPIAPPPPPNVQGAAYVAGTRDPARWAKVTELAASLNLSPNFVDQNFDALSAERDRRQSEAEMGTTSPTFRDWVSDPDNATLSKHEIPPLAQADRAARLIADKQAQSPFLRAINALPIVTQQELTQAGVTGFSDLEAGAAHILLMAGRLSPEQAAYAIADANKNAAALRQMAPDYAKEFSAAMAAHGNDINKAVRSMSASQEAMRSSSIMAVLRSIQGPIGTTADAVEAAPTAAKTVGQVLSMLAAMIARPRGLAYSTVEGLASFAPALVGGAAGAKAGAAAGLLGGPFAEATVPIGSAIGMGTGTFLGLAPVSVGSEINAELVKRGVDVTDGHALLQAFNDPALMQRVRAVAERHGITSAAVNSLAAMFGGRFSANAAGAAEESATRAALLAPEMGEVERAAALEAAKTATPPLRARLSAGVADASTLTGGLVAADVAGQAAASKGDLSQVDVGQAITGAAQMLGFVGAEHAIGVSRRAALHPDPIRAAEELTVRAYESLQAEHGAQVLGELGDAVQRAPTTSSVPSRLKALIETASGGRDASTVYFQPAEWNSYWESKGASPAEMAASIMGDGGRAYDDARSTGSVLAIPLSDYVAHVAPTEHWHDLLPLTRTSVDGPTLQEAQEYMASLPATLSDLSREVSTPSSKTEESVAAVASTVKAQLRAAGRSAAEAKRGAEVWSSAMRALGERTNQDPLEVFNRYKLAISGPDAETSPDVTAVHEALQSPVGEPMLRRAQDPEEAAPPARPEQTSPGREAGRPVDARARFADFLDRGVVRSDDSRRYVTAQPFARAGVAGDRRVRVLADQVTALARHTPDPVYAADLASIGKLAPKTIELDPSDKASATKFHQAITGAKAALRFGSSVYVYKPEEYAGMRLFLSESGRSGVALKGDDIASVFSTEKGGEAMHALGVQNGGRTLDAFDTVLPDIYARNGMRVVSRLPWDDTQAPEGWDYETFKAFNGGRPDVVFMVHDPHFAGDRLTGERASSYDEAVRLQQEAKIQPAKPPVIDRREPVMYEQPARGKSPTQTKAFKDWFGRGKNKSHVVDENGDPLRVFHGTTGNFDTFDTERANPESDWGKGIYFSNTPEDVAANYASEAGPDLEAKIEHRAELIFGELEEQPSYGNVEYNRRMDEARAQAREELGVEHQGATMPVFLNIKNPFEVGGERETRLDWEQPYDEETDDYGEPRGTLVEFMDALRHEASHYDSDVDGVLEAIQELGMNDQSVTASTLIEAIRGDERFSSSSDDNGSLNAHEIVRAALERIGFDGIIDHTVDVKFGSQRRLGQSMKGMTPETVHYIAFKPEQVKSAIGNRGTFDPNDPNVLHQSAPTKITFFSQLGRQIDAGKLDAAPAQGWKDYIKSLGTKGVKADEILWSGLNDWLDLQPGKVDKAQVLKFLADGGPTVTERLLSGKTLTETYVSDWKDDPPEGEYLTSLAQETHWDDAIAKLAETWQIDVDGLTEKQAMAKLRKANISKADIQEKAEELALEYYWSDQDREQHKEATLTYDGKDYDYVVNYRFNEIDIWPKDGEGESIYEGKPLDDAQIAAKIREHLAQKLGIDDLENTGPQFENWKLPGGEDYRELLLQVPDPVLERGQHRQKEHGVRAMRYDGPHFQWPNILAHIRLTTRKAIDGAKVLFVEEIQSDWAQQGREKGFVLPHDAWTPADEARYQELRKTYVGPYDQNDAEVKEYEALDRKRTQYQDESGVPRGPFVMKTEAWVSLAIKKIIAAAVEGGFDRVAWTTGEQQADRYNLAKHISAVQFVPEIRADMPGVGRLRAYDRSGNMVLSELVPPEKIGDYVGQEVAAKLLATAPGPLGDRKPAARAFEPPSESAIAQWSGHVLSGLDLTTGGEGMQAFYDKIVPQLANDILKKVGGGKVRDDEIITFRSDRQPPGGSMPNGLAGRQHGFDITPAIRESLTTNGLPLFQERSGSPRGVIRIGPDHELSIGLLESADRSTFLHETAHAFLDILTDQATRSTATPELQDDLAAARKWLGAEGDAPLTTEQHEQWARGFEKYLAEGKAPSAGLREAFARFKTWLLGVYKDLTSLNVELTPEVRGVFDRLLATRAEITAAESEQAVEPLFADPQSVGMSDLDATRYSAAIRDARQTAEEEVTAAMMKTIRREESAQWKTWRDPIKTQVEAEVNARPEYRALAFLRDGTNPDGTALPDGASTFKLHREAVKASYGLELYNKLPKGVTTGDEGVNPNIAAEMLGFENGRALVEALANAVPKDKLINQLADDRTRAEHGDRMTPEEITAKAQAAVRGEKRAAVIRLELQHLASDHFAASMGLTRAVTKPVPSSEQARADAAKIVGGKLIRDLKPHLFERAAVAAARATIDAIGRKEFETAFDLKRKELLATEVFRAAQAAKESLDDALTLFGKVFARDEKLSTTRDMDLINAARSVLANFGVARAEHPAEFYLAQLHEYDPELAATVQAMVDAASQGATDYKQLTVDQFATLHETIAGMWSLSREAAQIRIDGVRRSRVEVRNELIARARALRGSGDLAGYHEAVSKTEKVKVGLMAFRAISRRIEHWIRAVDGGDPGGVFRRYLWNLISEPADRFREAKQAAITEYVSFLKDLRARDDGMPMTREKIPAKEIDYTFTGHNELLGALLHRGNPSNFAKLLVGRGWGSIDDAGLLDTSRWDRLEKRLRADGTLTKAHYDFVQGVWDRFEQLKPDAQRAHKRQYGRYFSEITSEPFTNEFGTFKGGYYPAKVDPDMVPDAAARADQNMLNGANNSFMFPSVDKGFTKARVDNYRKPLGLDASAVPQHFDAVLRFTHLGPAVRDVARIVMDPAFREALGELDPTIVSDALVPWLHRAGQQRSESAPEGGRFWRAANQLARTVRNNAALQIMTMNSTVLLEQTTHFPAIFVRVKGTELANALWAYATHPKKMAAENDEMSVMLRTRSTAAMTEAKTEMRKILLDPSVFETVSNFTQAHSRFLMAGVQHVMDHLTWRAAYTEAIGRDMTQVEAVRHADATIRETLGSYAPEDVSRIEAGTPIQRLMTMFYGFWNTKANIMGTEAAIAEQLGVRKGAGRAMGAYFWGMMVPLSVGLAIKAAMRGEDQQQDDEGTLHALLRTWGQSQVEGVARMIPFAGPAITVAEQSFGKARPQAELLTSPAIKMVEEMLATPGDAYKAIESKTLTAPEVADFLTLVGMMSGFPLRPLANPIKYARDVKSGVAIPSSPLDYGRGLLTGRHH